MLDGAAWFCDELVFLSVGAALMTIEASWNRDVYLHNRERRERARGLHERLIPSSIGR
jgi:hypothetical protein